MNSRKYHRSSMNWNRGRLTYTYHHPAGESWRPPATGVEYQVDTCRAP